MKTGCLRARWIWAVIPGIALTCISSAAAGLPAGGKKGEGRSLSHLPDAAKIIVSASVVGAVLATLLAIHLGFAVVILLAVLIYGVACAALRKFA